MRQEQIKALFEETFKSKVPGNAPENVAELTKLLSDATNAYVAAMANPSVSVEDIQKEYVAQVQTQMESLRFDALNMRFGPEEVVTLVSKLIPILMA